MSLILSCFSLSESTPLDSRIFLTRCCGKGETLRSCAEAVEAPRDAIVCPSARTSGRLGWRAEEGSTLPAWCSCDGAFPNLNPDPGGFLLDEVAVELVLSLSTLLEWVGVALGAGRLSSFMSITPFGSPLGFAFFSFASFEDTPRLGGGVSFWV